MGAALDLVYRYTVTGSDKASIDTGVDTPQAGSNDWTGGDLLEVYLYARTDEAVTASLVDVNFNNDTGANYNRHGAITNSGSVSQSFIAAQTTFSMGYIAAASMTANLFSTVLLTIPNYAGTVGWKGGTALVEAVDATSATAYQWTNAFTYKSTSAITRLAVLPDTAGKKFKVGSQLLIYKRVATSDSKISALTAATALASTDELVLNNSGTSKKITGTNLRAAMPGAEIGYDEITSSVNVTSTTEASGTTVISCAAHTFDGAPVICEFFSPQVLPAATSGGYIVINLFESSTQIGRLAVILDATAANLYTAVHATRRFTPSAGSHTYTISAFVSSTTGGPQVSAGAGGTGTLLPAYCRFIKV